MHQETTAVNVNNVAKTRGDKALLVAAKEGQTDAVKSLLKSAFVNVNATDESGLTALHWAVMQGHEEVAKVIEKARMSRNAPSLANVTSTLQPHPVAAMAHHLTSQSDVRRTSAQVHPVRSPCVSHSHEAKRAN